MTTICAPAPWIFTEVSEMPTDFGTWLRHERDARGWTMEDLADAINSAQSVISNLERGKRRPSPEMVERLVHALAAESDSDIARRMLNRGLKAAFNIEDDDDDLDEVREAGWNRVPPEQQRAILTLIKGSADNS